MEKTAYHIKGQFPQRYTENVHALNFDTKEVKFFEHHYDESAYNGRLWVDRIELKAGKATALRPDFGGQDFSWGWASSLRSITSIAICLHIFKDEDIALNMYLPFEKEFLEKLERKSFEITIDITDFIIEHRKRLTADFYTRYFEFSYFGRHEINILKEAGKNKFMVHLFDQISRSIAEEEEKNETASANMKNDSLISIKKSLLLKYFTHENSEISKRTLNSATKETHLILKGFYGMVEEELKKKSRQHFLKMIRQCEELGIDPTPFRKFI